MLGNVVDGDITNAGLLSWVLNVNICSIPKSLKRLTNHWASCCVRKSSYAVLDIITRNSIVLVRIPRAAINRP